MELKEYISKAKKELDDMEEEWIKANNADPGIFPLEMAEEEWKDQESSKRFSWL